ncbi:hypothetical protein LTR91_024643 [Friedmanniomyces endolithicus]|uniref:Uncharacterized protein n=1 Tax=Friedmanniomyces endolithicus TaxID=329885 RepID=A0AAN6JF06_9PEZI|nr:hypothetical protein LTR35_013145 [Friedmanniomyces endolithicus]KAK0298422.1 hypothetical protein LTS00_002802 [Friedmanniomyces endolithicus]KAK0327735.1 hypothetical protein LTR82_001252 [Friedmanniomyces endolithicus]KAK0891477.1 hypothetical protein LTR57_024763 [Friedmanniomyces endolithicus]KAK0952029.1 hypothetical protein LTR91_024643 [Friedmanniomyces endolithicus]
MKLNAVIHASAALQGQNVGIGIATSHGKRVTPRITSEYSLRLLEPRRLHRRRVATTTRRSRLGARTADIGGSQALFQLVAKLQYGKPFMLLDHLTDDSTFTAMAVPRGHFDTAPVALQQNPSNHHFTGEYYAETPNQPGQYFNGSHCTAAQDIAQTPNGTATGSIPPTPGSLAGRKRSRGDIHAEDEEDDMLEDGSITTSVTDGTTAQSFTWGDGQPQRRPFELGHIKRPSVSSRKSMRGNASISGPDDLAHLLLPPQIREATAEPLIDEATRALGISWTRMDSTEVLQINKAAYSKWIRNFYPGLKDVEVWFENSALPGYLVEARNAYSGQQAYYIFSHDLTEARLVTTESAQLVPRLRLLPALHLAAPGGHIRAETDPITAAQNEVSGVQVDMAAATGGVSKVSGEARELKGQQIEDDISSYGVTVEAGGANGHCSAHEMELD